MRTIFGRDSKNRVFIDRDGVLFRYILDYLRNKKLSLPENFSERDRLQNEADYYRLTGMSQALGHKIVHISMQMANILMTNMNCHDYSN